jgi:hypothetical protein
MSIFTYGLGRRLRTISSFPGMIARVIASLKSSDREGPLEAEVSESLARLADGLRDETLDALAAELSASDRAGGVARANRLAPRAGRGGLANY